MDKINYSKNVVESMIDTLIVVNPDARIKWVNYATERLLGYKKSELVGKPIGNFIPREIVSLINGLRQAKYALEETVQKRTSALESAKNEIEHAYNMLKQTQAQLVQTEKLSLQK